MGSGALPGGVLSVPFLPALPVARKDSAGREGRPAPDYIWIRRNERMKLEVATLFALLALGGPLSTQEQQERPEVAKPQQPPTSVPT